jgi:TPR repeat protein
LAKAQFNLGNHYFTGKGIGHDLGQAAEWYGKAANQGFVLAMLNLGNLYREGRGIEHDDEQAERWYVLASEAAVPGSKEQSHAKLLLEDLGRKPDESSTGVPGA